MLLVLAPAQAERVSAARAHTDHLPAANSHLPACLPACLPGMWVVVPSSQGCCWARNGSRLAFIFGVWCAAAGVLPQHSPAIEGPAGGRQGEQPLHASLHTIQAATSSLHLDLVYCPAGPGRPGFAASC
jgi:hypothetical protein